MAKHKTGFAIAGWFTQDGVRFALNPEGSNSLIYVADGMYPFYGALGSVKEDMGRIEFEGWIIDKCGNAQIKGILTETTLSFKKKYVNRGDVIDYDFTPDKTESDLWVGAYKGPAVGTGNAKLQLTQLPSKFFQGYQ